MRESQVEAHLVKRVKALGGEVRKVQWIGRRGAPDRVVMLPPFTLRAKGTTDEELERVRKAARKLAKEFGRPFSTVWVELKRPGEVAEPHQAREHERMRAMGQRVEVLDSIEAVNKFIEGIL
jgi:hypothetical protein